MTLALICQETLYQCKRFAALLVPLKPDSGLSILTLVGAKIAEQVSAHFAHLDFLAAFRDPVAAMMAIDMLERLVARIANPAMDLHRPVCRLAHQPVRPVIAHGNLVGDGFFNLGMLHIVHLPSGLVDQQAQHLALGGKLDQRELDRLIARQLLPEGFACARVSHALLDTELRRAQR